MKLKDWTEIAAWAGISTVIGLAAFGGRTAVSDGARQAPQLPAATVGECHVTAQAVVQPSHREANVKLSIANPSATPKTVTFDVDVVSRQFVGSPIARVASPNDVRTTNIEHRQISRTVAARTIMPVIYAVPQAAFAPKPLVAQKSKPFQLPPSYEVMVSANGKQTQLTTFNMTGA